MKSVGTSTTQLTTGPTSHPGSDGDGGIGLGSDGGIALDHPLYHELYCLWCDFSFGIQHLTQCASLAHPSLCQLARSMHTSGHSEQRVFVWSLSVRVLSASLGVDQRWGIPAEGDGRQSVAHGFQASRSLKGYLVALSQSESRKQPKQFPSGTPTFIGKVVGGPGRGTDTDRADEAGGARPRRPWTNTMALRLA